MIYDLPKNPTVKDLSDATVVALRTQAVAHEWDSMVTAIDKELVERANPRRPSALTKERKMRR